MTRTFAQVSVAGLRLASQDLFGSYTPRPSVRRSVSCLYLGPKVWLLPEIVESSTKTKAAHCQGRFDQEAEIKTEPGRARLAEDGASSSMKAAAPREAETKWAQ